MRNHKQILADFYLDLLAIKEPASHIRDLMFTVRQVLAIELETSPANIEMIFTRMAREDEKI